MINKILQDSLTAEQTELYHLRHISTAEIESIILNYSPDKFRSIKIIVEASDNIFKISHQAYNNLIKIIKDNIGGINWAWLSTCQDLSEEFILEFIEQFKVKYEFGMVSIFLYQDISDSLRKKISEENPSANFMVFPPPKTLNKRALKSHYRLR